MQWITFPQVESEPKEWRTEERNKQAVSLSDRINELRRKQQELDKDETDYKSIPVEEINAKIIAVGRKLSERRILLLVDELPLRKEVVDFLLAEQEAISQWKAQINRQLPLIEAENKAFLIANGWVDPQSEAGKNIGGYDGLLGTAARIRQNYRDMNVKKAEGSYDGEVREQHKEAMARINQLVRGLQTSL